VTIPIIEIAAIEEEIREASSATCRVCGHVVELDALVVSGDVWRLG
jgi:hypothetical protein